MDASAGRGRARRAAGQPVGARRIAGSRGRLRQRRLACDRRPSGRSRARACRRRGLPGLHSVTRTCADRRGRPGAARLDASRRRASGRARRHRPRAGRRPALVRHGPRDRALVAGRARGLARGAASQGDRTAAGSSEPPADAPRTSGRSAHRPEERQGASLRRRIVGSMRWPAPDAPTVDGFAGRPGCAGGRRARGCPSSAREDRRATIGQHDRRAEQRDEHRERPGSGDGPNAAQGLHGELLPAGRQTFGLVRGGATRVESMLCSRRCQSQVLLNLPGLVHEVPPGPRSRVRPGVRLGARPGQGGHCGSPTRSSRGTSAR